MPGKERNTEEAQKRVKELEKQIEQLESKIESLTTTKVRIGNKTMVFDEKIFEEKIIRFFRSDRLFSGFRNTPARILITLLSIAVLFGYGYFAFMNPLYSLWYLGLIFIVLIMQSISVRFVFNLDASTPDRVLDEYHQRRRDKAMQRAYESLNFMIGASLLGAFLYGYRDYIFGDKEFSFNPLPDAVFDFSLSGGQFLVIAFFVSGWVSLQKYWSYGMKGEPMRSHEETERIRNS